MIAAAAPITLVVGAKEGETRKSVDAYSIGAISIEMGLGTTKIYKNCRDSSTMMRGGGAERTEYTVETRGKLPEGTLE